MTSRLLSECSTNEAKSAMPFVDMRIASSEAQSN